MEEEKKENNTTSNTETAKEQTKDLGGRPLKFMTVKELDAQIKAYFSLCDPHVEEKLVESGIDGSGKTIWLKREVMTEQQPYGVNGLAAILGTTRETLSVYESGDYDDRAEDFAPDGRRFSDAIKDAKAQIKAYIEKQLFIGKQPTGAIFWLKNNDGWKDKSETDITSGGEKIEPIRVMEFKKEQ